MVLHRDSDVLQLRYNQVLFRIRNYAKWERQNAVATGCGPAVAKPKAIKIEVTGPLLEVKKHFEKLITGLHPFDSDYNQQLSVQQPLIIVDGELYRTRGRFRSGISPHSSLNGFEIGQQCRSA